MHRSTRSSPALRLAAAAGAVAYLALGHATPACSTTLAPWTLEDFVAHAYGAVTATVTGIDVRWNEERTQIHSYVTLDLDELVAGAALPDPLVLDELGGRVGNQVAVLEGAPVYRKGEQVFVFVEKVDDIYRTLGFYQGKYVLEKDPATGRELYVQRVPAGGGVSTVVDGGGFEEPEAVVYGREELIQRVREIASR